MLEFYDELHSDEEERYIGIGKVDKVLFVVYTERPEHNATRLISARLANARESNLVICQPSFSKVFLANT